MSRELWRRGNYKLYLHRCQYDVHLLDQQRAKKRVAVCKEMAKVRLLDELMKQTAAVRAPAAPPRCAAPSYYPRGCPPLRCPQLLPKRLSAVALPPAITQEAVRRCAAPSYYSRGCPP